VVLVVDIHRYRAPQKQVLPKMVVVEGTGAVAEPELAALGIPGRGVGVG